MAKRRLTEEEQADQWASQKLKERLSEARGLAQSGRNVEALEVLEGVFHAVNVQIDLFGSYPELEKVLAAARQLSGQIRGQMTQVTLQGPELGLHKKEERQHAYTLAQRAYQKALRTDSQPEYNYALGYIEAIGDLILAEAPDDKELLGLIGDMQAELFDRGAISPR